MGTTARVVITDKDMKPLVTMYSQYDGYPEGLGKWIVESFENSRLGNGIADETDLYSNGIECFAATFVAGMKNCWGGGKAGNVYCIPSDSSSRGEEYLYCLSPTADGGLNLSCQEGMITFFGMPGNEPEDMMHIVYDGEIEGFADLIVTLEEAGKGTV